MGAPLKTNKHTKRKKTRATIIIKPNFSYMMLNLGSPKLLFSVHLSTIPRIMPKEIQLYGTHDHFIVFHSLPHLNFSCPCIEALIALYTVSGSRRLTSWSQSVIKSLFKSIKFISMNVYTYKSWMLQMHWAMHSYSPCLSGSVQFSCSVMSHSLQPHGLQQARPPCPSPTPRVYPNSCPLSRWCHPTISSSVILFSRLQSFPKSGSFLVSQVFKSGGQSIGLSAST